MVYLIPYAGACIPFRDILHAALRLQAAQLQFLFLRPKPSEEVHVIEALRRLGFI